MKIAILSDTHLKRVSETLEALFENHLSDKDLIVHAGDVVSLEIVDFLRQRPFHGVSGNMDPLDVQSVLPSKKIFEVEGHRFGLIHGWGPSGGLEERIQSQFTDVDVIIFGHSHHPLNRVKAGVLLFNPGTATGYSPEGVHSIGVLDVGESIRGEIITL